MVGVESITLRYSTLITFNDSSEDKVIVKFSSAVCNSKSSFSLTVAVNSSPSQRFSVVVEYLSTKVVSPVYLS